MEQLVQDSVESSDELIAALDQVAAGSLQNWECIGNAYEVVLSPDGVLIECLWADDNCTLSLADFRESVVAWRNFISGPDAR